MSIKENLKHLTLEEAKTKVPDYQYALIYEMSSMTLDRVEMLGEISWTELQEAFFFDENGQMHLFAGEDGLEAVVFTEPEGANAVTKEYPLAGKFGRMGTKVKEREYLENDDDGQVYVAYTRLVSVE